VLVSIRVSARYSRHKTVGIIPVFIVLII
jgi:hypothetical protein